MSTEQRTKWEIPKSYDIGVPPYFHNMLKGSPYLDAYWRAQVAFVDDSYKKFYAELEQNPDKKFNYDDVPQTAAYGMRYAVEHSGIDEKYITQICSHINYLALDPNGKLNFLRFKEFLAFCGIEGVYDLENKRHFKVKAPTRSPVDDLRSEWWLHGGDLEQNRLNIGMMMDVNHEVEALYEQRANLPRPETKGRDKDLQLIKQQEAARLERDLTPEEEQKLFDDFVASHDDLRAYHHGRADLTKAIADKIEELKDKFAPTDGSYHLPEVGTEFDKTWYHKAVPLMASDVPYIRLYESHMESLGKPRGAPDHVQFQWADLRHRTFAVEDYALRDYTMNLVNRGENAAMRRHDIPRSFVETVLYELEDSLMDICKPPHRIEKIEGKPDHFRFIINNAETGEFTLEDVLQLEASFEENKEDPLAFRKNIAKARKSMYKPYDRLREPKPDEVIKVSAEYFLANKDKIQAQINKTYAEEMAAKEALPKPEPEDPNAEIPFPMFGAERLKELVAQGMPPTEEVARNSLPHHKAALEAKKAEALVTQSGPSPAQAPSASTEGKTADKVAEQTDSTKDATASTSEASKGTEEDVAINFGEPNPIKSFANEKNEPNKPESAPEKTSSTAQLSPEQKKKIDAMREYAKSPFAQEQQPAKKGNDQGSAGYGGYGGRPPALEGGLAALKDSFSIMGHGIKRSLFSAVPQRASADQLSNQLYQDADRLSDLRESLSSLTDDNGKPLMPQQMVESWQEVNQVLKRIDTTAKLANSVRTGKANEQLLSALEDAKDEIDQTKPLMDKTEKMPGKVGELAKQAKQQAEAISKTIMTIIDALMRMLGLKKRDKEPGSAWLDAENSV